MTSKKKEAWPSVSKAIRRGIRRLREKTREAPLFVHVSEVDVSYQIPDTFKEDEFAGLELIMHLESTATKTKPRLLTFWGDQGFFSAQRERLQSVLSLDLSQGQGLCVTDGRHSSSSKLWAKIGLWLGALAVIATACANLDQISKAGLRVWNGFLGTANAEFVTIQGPPIQAIDGERKTLNFECRNLGACPISLTLLPVDLQNAGNSQVLDNNRRKFASIDVGGTRPFSVSFVPKDVATETTIPLTIKGKINAAWFGWGEKELTSKDLSIEIWPRVDRKPTVQFERMYRNGTLAVYVVVAHHGRAPAAGVNYEAQIVGVNDAKLIEVDPGPGATLAGDDVSSIRWRVTGLEPFSVETYKLTIQSENQKTDEDWKKLAFKIEVHVDTKVSKTTAP